MKREVGSSYSLCALQTDGQAVRRKDGWKEGYAGDQKTVSRVCARTAPEPRAPALQGLPLEHGCGISLEFATHAEAQTLNQSLRGSAIRCRTVGSTEDVERCQPQCLGPKVSV